MLTHIETCNRKTAVCGYVSDLKSIRHFFFFFLDMLPLLAILYVPFYETIVLERFSIMWNVVIPKSFNCKIEPLGIKNAVTFVYLYLYSSVKKKIELLRTRNSSVFSINEREGISSNIFPRWNKVLAVFQDFCASFDVVRYRMDLVYRHKSRGLLLEYIVGVIAQYNWYVYILFTTCT